MGEVEISSFSSRPCGLVLVCTVQRESWLQRGHVKVDTSGQLWSNTAGGGRHAFPTAHLYVCKQILAFLFRKTPPISLKVENDLLIPHRPQSPSSMNKMW